MNSIIIFTKAPVIGKVKTRMQHAIDRESLLKLYTAFVRDTVIKVNNIKELKRYLFYEFEEGGEIIYSMMKGFEFEIFLQRGKNLGEKMSNAIVQIMKNKNDKVIIIGADSPTLPSGHIKQAFYLLEKKDIVVGPSTDGGYYLIGMKGFVFEVFDDINWGTDTVMRQTLQKIKQHDLRLGALHPWYDVDRVEDLTFLKNHLEFLSVSGEQIPENTYRCLKELRIVKYQSRQGEK